MSPFEPPHVTSLHRKTPPPKIKKNIPKPELAPPPPKFFNRDIKEGTIWARKKIQYEEAQTKKNSAKDSMYHVCTTHLILLTLYNNKPKTNNILPKLTYVP